MRFYFDEMVTRKAVAGLVSQGHEVVMAIDVDMTEKDDFEHLAYATENHLVMVTFDKRFAGLAMERADHTGLICITGEQQDDIGGIVRLLNNFAETHTAEDSAGHVFWLK